MRSSTWLGLILGSFVLAPFLATCEGALRATTDAGAATDAAPPDGGNPCTQPSDCNDGLYCNGEETCTEGRCVAGDPIVCDDGVACTQDVCSDELRECASRPPDNDDDGHGDASCLDESGAPLGDDCDDEDANRFPGNLELCDEGGHDEDCDTNTYGAVDRDEDGFDDARCCNTDASATAICGQDCDDTRANVNTTATEACDGIDNNCDGEVDEGVAIDGYVDNDRDGFGDSSTAARLCAGANGFATQGGDCDDNDIARNPGQVEVCDGQDNDCDPNVDEETSDVPWYADLDGDGFGSAGSGTTIACTPPANHSLVNTDCNDSEAAVNPAAAELCDGLDNDCSGTPDYRIGVNDFEDDDEDGFVDLACGAPLGTDCDDQDAITGAGSRERCDGRDNDCDEKVDEGATDAVWFYDDDGDGYGSPAAGAIISCQPISGYARRAGDCDDNDPTRSPAGIEACDGIDNDCDSTADEAPAASTTCALNQATSACLSGLCVVANCVGGFGDCDDNDSTGCETPLNDGLNCGSCGNNCDAPNATSTCDGTSCSPLTCASGWGDCDGFRDSGCERPLTNEDNCGGCDVPCQVVNGRGDCSTGSCMPVGCDPDWDDCDGDPTDCETDVRNDTSNCGSCGASCNFQNGMGSCQNRSCQLNNCNIGWDSCDGDNSNGCETDTLTTATHCGGCNQPCSAPNSTMSCAGGSCLVNSCASNWDNCDGNDFNGCEADLQNDPMNCNGCGNMCNVFNGQGQCSSGSCSIQGCFTDFADCDGVAGTGCEADFNWDNLNCGGCGNDCNTVFTNGSGNCQLKTCILGGCNFPWENCDGNDANGCESDRNIDPANCGGCMIDCGAGGECNNGECDQLQTIVAGEKHGCALRSSGNVVCWGDNGEGRVDPPTAMTPVTAPTPVLTGVLDLAAGARHTCAVLAGGGSNLRCWGDNSDGQLGDGSTTSSDVAGSVATVDPVSATAMGPVTRVAAGTNHTCAINLAGEVWCWGSDGSEQLGNGVAGGSALPIKAMLAGGALAIDVATGDGFTCSLTDMDIQCWGANALGQLGLGTTGPNVDTPTTVPAAIPSPQALLAGTNHICAYSDFSGGRLDCWGDNGLGQIGQGATTECGGAGNCPTPTLVPIVSISHVSVGAFHTCAQDSFGGVSCWGDNTSGQVGTGATGGAVPSPSSVVDGMGGFISVQELGRGGPAALHTCALFDPNNATCWGENASAQLGTGATGVASGTPVPVSGL